MEYLLDYYAVSRVGLELTLVVICFWVIKKYRATLYELSLLTKAGRNYLKGMPVTVDAGVRHEDSRSLLRLLQITGARAKRSEFSDEPLFEFGVDEHANLTTLANSLLTEARNYLITKPTAARIYLRKQGDFSLIAQTGPNSSRFGRVIYELVGSLDLPEQVSEICVEDDSLKGFGISRQLVLKFSLAEKSIDSGLLLWLGFKDGMQSSYSGEKAAFDSLIRKSKLLISQFERISSLERELGEERDNFLGISHDLKAPGITALYLVRELQGKQDLMELNGARYLDLELLILEQLSLIQDFLDLERDKRSAIAVTPQLIELRDFISTISESPIIRYRSKEVGFRIDVPFDLAIRFDRNQLKRVVINLLTNAFKFTDSGEVVLGLRQVESGYELFVSDTGRGIGEELQESLFSSFNRLDAPSHICGTGIGLSASRLLVEKNGAQLKFAPRKGGGSIFMLAIPPKLVEKKAAIKVDSGKQEASNTILILEDDEASCRLYSRILSANGLAGDFVSTLGEARIKFASNKNYRALICDFHLPDGDSITLIKELSHQGRSIPTLVISGTTEYSKSDQQTLNLLEQLFFVRILAKPIDRLEFETALEELLSGPIEVAARISAL